MTKKVSSPPVIILLDLLFLLVFILILNQSSQTNISFSKDKLFKGAILIYREDGIKYLVNQDTREIGDIYFPKANTGYSYFEKCKQQCREYTNLNQNNLYIYLPNNLFNQIAKVSYIASNTDYNCKNLKFKIMDNGKIDVDKLLENDCVKGIEGIDILRRY
ncbi:MAG TPA: hypothetical protein EYG73_00510 [Arcobacter sp.]|nr:hypothetical protein [Arcobacter sp.]